MAQRNAAEQLYRTIVEHAGEAIIIVQDGAIMFCNNRAVRLSGFSKQELQRLSWPDLVHPDDREMMLRKCETDARGQQREDVHTLRIRDKPGNIKWLELHQKRIAWNGGDAALVFGGDITERKRLESQFLQAQKMEAVGRLAGGIAHDFNNVLTVILGYTELLEIEQQQKGEAATNIHIIRDAARKASVLTQKLLAFSRKQRLEPKVIDLNRLIRDMQGIVKRLVGEKIEVELKPQNPLGAIHADANQLEQVILNLVVNAKDAMEQGGRLTIATENTRFTPESLKPRPEMKPGHYVMLSITDTGCGMDENTKAHLFEPFYTTKESGRGTGLGLATVYGIIKQSNGFIYVYSEPAFGTTFKLYFPRVDEAPVEFHANEVSSGVPTGSETILVLEDEEQVLKIIENMLRRRGYNVLTAESGKAAAALSRHSAVGIDLLITDVGIPDMRGREVWELVKRQHPDSRVLFISGYPQDFASVKDIEAATQIFLQKPFSSDTLLQRVRATLDSGRT